MRGAKLVFGASEAEDRARFEVAASNPAGGSANYQFCFQIVVGSSRGETSARQHRERRATEHTQRESDFVRNPASLISISDAAD
jgi:hypothetical protein